MIILGAGSATAAGRTGACLLAAVGGSRTLALARRTATRCALGITARGGGGGGGGGGGLGSAARGALAINKYILESRELHSPLLCVAGTGSRTRARRARSARADARWTGRAGTGAAGAREERRVAGAGARWARRAHAETGLGGCLLGRVAHCVCVCVCLEIGWIVLWCGPLVRLIYKCCKNSAYCENSAKFKAPNKYTNNLRLRPNCQGRLLPYSFLSNKISTKFTTENPQYTTNGSKAGVAAGLKGRWIWSE